MTEEQMKELMDYMDSPEFEQNMIASIEKMNAEHEKQDAQYLRIYNLVKDDMPGFIEKLTIKSAKRPYGNREALDWFIVDCARNYGVPATEEHYNHFKNPFIEEGWIYYGHFFGIMHGQGSCPWWRKYEPTT